MSADAEIVGPGLSDEEAIWRLASALAASVTPFDVAEALALDGGSAAGGSFANMAVFEPVSGTVRVVRHFENTTEWRAYPASAEIPACDAIRSGQPVLLGSAEEICARYPDIVAEVQAADLSARVSMPLRRADGATIGAAGFGWQTAQPFDAAQLRRLDLIAQLTGLALERAVVQATQPRQEAALTRILATMPNGFCSVSPDFQITAINAEGEKLLRWEPGGLTGRNLFEAFPDVGASEFERQFRRAAETDRPVVFEEHCGPLRTWFEVRAWPDVSGLNVYFSSIDERRNTELERIVALDEAKQANVRLSLLATVSLNLSGVVTQSDVFERLAATVIETPLAKWCTIVVPRGEELVRVAAAHRDPALDGLAKRLVGGYPHAFSGPSPGVTVYRSGESLRLDRLAQQIVDELDDSVDSTGYGRTLQLLGDGPGLITPIHSDHGVVAVLTISRPITEPYSDADVSLVSELAIRVATVLDDAAHIEAQREAATALQNAALPKSLPVFDELQLAAGYRAASEGVQVGGDWYDAFELQTGRIALVVGDVAGHGVQAAAIMAQMRNTLRAHLFSSFGLGDSLSRLSSLIAAQERDAFATIICVELDPATGELTWASAGHPAPILVAADGTSTHLRGHPAAPIGWMQTASPHPAEHKLVLKAGERLLLFTDGLIERRGTDIAIGLTHLMLHAEQTYGLGAEQACEVILERLLVTAHPDDMCLLIADFTP
jgi:serine phosphatase RsbU (regulator of sigma subunit)/PAS domain-containing protein